MQTLSTSQFAGLLIDGIVGFAQERPAYLNLHGVPIAFRRDPSARAELLRIVTRTGQCGERIGINRDDYPVPRG